MTAGIEDQNIAAWLDTTFNADATLMAAATGGVWDGAAKEGTSYPLLQFDTQSPGVIVRGVGTSEIMVNSLWLIRAVTDGGSFASLKTIAARVQQLIHGVTGLTLPDGMIVSCVREQAFRLETLQGGREFRHLGGIYRIYAQA